MSSLEDDLIKKLRAFERARSRAEKRTGADLWDLYERARVETLEQLIDRFGQLEEFELQHIEGVLREIDRITGPVTTQSADLRMRAIERGWEVGQQLTLDMLGLDSTISPPLASLTVRVGYIDRAMVGHLFGNVPQLAGKVTADLRERIRNELVVSAIRGESIPKMARRIAGTGLTQEGLKRPFGTLRKRAITIARTEVIKAADAGYEDMVSKAQEVIEDEIYDLWLTARDHRVDPPCNHLENEGWGQFKPIAGYPGVYRRSSAPRPVIDTHPNCRCRRVPILLRWLKEGLVKLPNLKAS